MKIEYKSSKSSELEGLKEVNSILKTLENSKSIGKEKIPAAVG
jgi:hypothetical protein